jgi:putative phosphoesterase
MLICIVSDSHDNRRLLDHAVEDAAGRGAQAILHCGDIVAPTTLRVLKKYGLPVHAIHGNNMGDTHAMHQLVQEPDNPVRYYGQDAVVQLAGRSIFLVHYPHYAHGMALTGDYDIVCCGHDHRVSVREIANVKGGRTFLVNPGTVGGVGKGPTYILADLERLSFDIYDVPVEPGEACNVRPASVHA